MSTTQAGLRWTITSATQADLATAVGAKPPRRVPTWLAKPLIGEAGVWLMTKAPGASNAKAKRELGWTLRYPSWRIGFRHGLYEERAMGA